MVTSRNAPTTPNTSTYGTSGAGRDYTALATWEAATDNDLVTATAGEILDCYDDAASFDDNVDMADSTVNTAYYRLIRSASGQGHDGTPNNGVHFIPTSDGGGSSAGAFQVHENNSSFQDFIISLSENGAGSSRVIRTFGTLNRIVGVIDNDSVNAGSGSARSFAIDGNQGICINCISINAERHGFDNSPGAGNTGYFYNNTAIGAGVEGFHYSGGTAGVLKNCLGSGNTTDFDTGGTWTGSITCASSDTSASSLPTGGHRASQTFTFENAAGDDYHLQSSDAGAKDFGTDLSSDAFISFDDDINDGTMGGGKAGQTRSGSWDIGFDEFIAVPLPPVPDVIKQAVSRKAIY